MITHLLNKTFGNAEQGDCKITFFRTHKNKKVISWKINEWTYKDIPENHIKTSVLIAQVISYLIFSWRK